MKEKNIAKKAMKKFVQRLMNSPIFIFEQKRPFIIFNLSCGERLFIFIFSR